MNSLERRLQLGLVLSLLLLMSLFWMVGNQSLRQLTENFIVSRLEHDTESLLRVISAHPERLLQQEVDPIFNLPFSGHYYLVLFNDGRKLTSRSLWDHALEIPRLAPGESRRLHRAGPSGQQLLVLVKGYDLHGVKFTLAVTEDLTPIEAERDRFTRNFALLGLLGIALLLVMQRLVVRRSFRRLERVREDIRRLEQREVERLSEDAPAEVLPLVQEFNHLLQLLGQRLERSRNALGNLAHSLKGPLNLLQQYFDGQHAAQTKETQQAGDQVERISRLMERELKRARMAGTGLPSRRFDPAVDLPGLIDVLNNIHRKRNLQIRYGLSGSIPPFGDHEDMLELLGNLLDNACKWANSIVKCGISRNDGQITMTVEDDGPGLSDKQIETITERGSRLDETKEGHGLGLAIVRDIINLYRGEIAFDHSPELGGLKVTVLLRQLT